MDIYMFDGFRFDGVISMMYKYYGIGLGFLGEFFLFFYLVLLIYYVNNFWFRRILWIFWGFSRFWGYGIFYVGVFLL